MSDIFREIEEDLRRDRAAALWQKYGVWIIAAAVALVVGVASVTGWNAYRQSAAEESAKAYLAAAQVAEEGDPLQAAAMFEALAEEAGDGYRTIARLRAATLHAEAGHRDRAVAAYDEVAAEGANLVLRELAALRAALLLSDVASTDELEIRLAPLAEPGRPWRFTALELLAFAALRAGDNTLAGERYRELSEAEGVPPLSRERARTMLRSLQIDGPVARQLSAPPAASRTSPQPSEAQQ